MCLCIHMQTVTYRYNCCMCLLLLQAIYTVNYFRTALFAVHGRLGLCSKKKRCSNCCWLSTLTYLLCFQKLFLFCHVIAFIAIYIKLPTEFHGLIFLTHTTHHPYVEKKKSLKGNYFLVRKIYGVSAEKFWKAWGKAVFWLHVKL